METIDALLAHPLILSDTTPFSPRRRNTYQDVIYPAKNFGELSRIEEEITYVRTHRDWFRQPNVCTTKRVVQEHARAYRMFREKLKNLNKRERSRARRKYGPRAKPQPTTNKTLFEDLVFGMSRLLIEATHAVLKPALPREYAQLVNAVTELSTRCPIKKDHSRRYGSKRKAADLRADEELVGAAIYLSLYEHKPCLLVTSDYDLRELLNATTTRLRTKEYALSTAPITLCITNGHAIEHVWNSADERRATVSGARQTIEDILGNTQ
ncbi:hypothetical protein D6789_02970 [Candidatus Woesearchaeota archaeon]|nr:MAG: hypothetical protein D6789_02970 [Candidatus Woesearchaeota archaeon]